MKKYIAIFLLFLASASYAQVHTVRTNGAVTPVDYDASFRYSLKIPVVVDTASAFSHGGIDSLGLVIQVRTTGDWWKRDTVSGGGHQWTKIGSGTGGSTDTTSLSARINAKKDKIDSVASGGYTTIANKNKLADSLMAVFNSLFKLSTDSVRLPGYTTIANKNKLADSLTANFNALLLLYKLGNDSVRLSGFTTVANKNKLADSLTANFNALLGLYKLGIDSVRGAGFTTVAHTNKVADSLRAVFNTLLAGKTDTSTKFNLYIQKDGGRGINTLRAHDSVLAEKGLIDSIDFHWRLNGDSTVTGYAEAHDTTSPNALQSKYRSDTARANLWAALAAKVANGGAAKSITVGILSARPAASNCQCFYGSTTDSVLYYDNGAWMPMGKPGSGGGGAPAGTTNQVQINNAGAFGVVPNFTADPATHVVSMDTAVSSKATTSVLKLNTQNIVYPHVDSLITAGNSITAGNNAVPITNAYAYLLANFLNVPLRDVGIPSAGAQTTINEVYNASSANTTAFQTWMAGFNDVRKATNLPQKTRNKILNATNAAWVWHNLKTYFAAGLSGVTRYGAWSAPWGSNGDGGKGNGAYTSTTNDSLVYSFTDTTVAIGLILPGTSSSIAGGIYNVYIDNTLVQTIDDHLNNASDGIADVSYDGTRIPAAFFYTGLTNATHKLKIVNTSTGYMLMDWVGNLVDHANSKPFLLFEAPHMNAAGYATAPNGATQALIDTINVKFDSLFATWPANYSNFLAKTNNFYDTTKGISSDHIHPNNTGHGEIATAGIFSLLNLPTYISASGSGSAFYTSTGNFWGISNGQYRQFAFQDQILPNTDSNYIKNQPTQNQTNGATVAEAKNFSISGYGYIGKDLYFPGIHIGNNNGNYDSAIRLGNNGPIPYLSFKNLAGAADSKNWDLNLQSSNLSLRLDNDGGSSFTTVFLASRSAMGLNYFSLPNGHILVGSGVDDNVEKLQVTGTVKITDTLKLPSIAYKTLDTVARKFIVKDASGNLFYTDAPGGGTSDSAIWKSNGTYTGNHTLAMAGFSQSFAGGRTSLDTILSHVTTLSTAKNAYFFGHSVVQGYYAVNASGNIDSARRWSALLCQNQGWTEVNRGLASLTAENRTPFVTNLLANFVTSIPFYSATRDTLFFIQCAINDITKAGQGLTQYNTNNYKADLGAYIDSVTGRLWAANQIVLIGDSYTDTLITTNNTKILQDSFFLAQQAVAANKGTLFIDIYHPSLANNSWWLFGQDRLHPGNEGHSAEAGIIINALGATVNRNGQTIAANGVTEVNQLAIKQADTSQTAAFELGLNTNNRVVRIPWGSHIINGTSINQNGTINLNGYAKINNPNIGAVLPDNLIKTRGLVLGNYFPATSGTQQVSPPISQYASYWNTTASKADSVNFFWYVNPVSGANAGASTYRLRTQDNNAASVDLMYIRQDGTQWNLSTGNSGTTTFNLGGGATTLFSNGAYNFNGNNIVNFNYGSGMTYHSSFTAATLYGTGDQLFQFQPPAGAYTVLDAFGGAGIVIGTRSGANPIKFALNGTVRTTLTGGTSGGAAWYIGGNSTATAQIHISAGTTTANTGALKLTAGLKPGTPEDGLFSYDTTGSIRHLYFGINNTAYQLDQQGGSTPTLQTVITNERPGGGGLAQLTKSDTISGQNLYNLKIDSFATVTIRGDNAVLASTGNTSSVTAGINRIIIAGGFSVQSTSLNSSTTLNSTNAPTYYVDLATPGAAAVLTLPSAGSSIQSSYRISNLSTSTTNLWTFAGAGLLDAFGNTVTSFPIGYAYEIFSDGSFWRIKNISNIKGIPIAGSYSNTGTATTTFTVTMGITEPTTTYKVNVTPTDVLGAALFYVTNKTATTFDVVYLSGLTGTVSFDWVINP